MTSARSPFTVAQRPARPAAPARSIPIRTVSRAAIEALVARLAAQGFAHV